MPDAQPPPGLRPRRGWRPVRWVAAMGGSVATAGYGVGLMIAHGRFSTLWVAWALSMGAVLIVVWTKRPTYRTPRRAPCGPCGWRGCRCQPPQEPS